MARVSEHFQSLPDKYFFPRIQEQTSKIDANKLINLGIGDVALPLAPAIGKAISDAAFEMCEHVIGYGPGSGYQFLKEAIAKEEFNNISPHEIFISSGLIDHICSLHEIFSSDATVALPELTYPGFLDSLIMGGKKDHVQLLKCREENNFAPDLPHSSVDIVILCTPANPTGIALTRDQLQIWVDWAIKNQAIILIDACYAPFVRSESVPKTIYELPGAKKVAIECHSLAKRAGFTGLRLGYTIIPDELVDQNATALAPLWDLRLETKTNGVAYPIQKGALASLIGKGRAETKKQVEHYLEQAHKLKTTLESHNETCFGGEDSPYVWWKIPKGISSWNFFNHLLSTVHLVTLPGIGFGPSGDGYVRLSGFATEETINKGIQALQQYESTHAL